MNQLPYLTDEQIDLWRSGLSLSMGQYEARDYLQWVNERNIDQREANTPESINRFRATTGALPGSIGEVTGPAGTMLVDTAARAGKSEVIGSSIESSRPQPKQQKPVSFRYGNQEIQMQNAAVAIARAQIAARQALEQPKSVMDALRDSMSIRVKAELGRKAAGYALNLSDARGDRKMQEAMMAESYNPARDNEIIDRLFAISRGTTVGGLKSTHEVSRGLNVLDVPEYAIDPDDYNRAIRLLSETPSGQAVHQQLKKKMSEAGVMFVSRVIEAQPRSTEEYLRVAKEEYGPMYKVMLPGLIESMPESVKQGDKIKEFEAMKREWTDGVILATGKDLVLVGDKAQLVDVPKERLEEIRRAKAAERIAIELGGVEIQSDDGRATALRAGVISKNQRLMLEELEKPVEFEPVPPQEITQKAGDKASVSLIAEQDIPNVANAVLREKLDGSTENYRSLISKYLDKFLKDAIVGEEAYKAAFAEAEEAYRSLVQSDVRRAINNYTAANIQRIQETDLALKDRSARFVSSIKDDGRIEYAAQRIARGGFTDTEINNEAWQIVAKDLELGRKEIEMYQALRHRHDVSEVMPEIHKAFTAARSALEAKIGEHKAKEYADLSKRITELSAKWQTYSPQERQQLVYFAQIPMASMYAPLSPSDLMQLAEGARRKEELTLKVDNREVGVFANDQQKRIAETMMASSKDKDDAMRMLKTFFPTDPNTGIMGITTTPIGSMIERIYAGEFDRLFEAPTSPMSGILGSSREGEIFTKDAKQDFVAAQKKWANQQADGKADKKRVFDPKTHLPKGMSDASGQWAEMYRNAAEVGDSFQMQAAYVGYLLEKDTILHQNYEDVVGELTQTLVAGGYADATGKGFRSTENFDELLSAVRQADRVSDPHVVIALDLLESIKEKEKTIASKIASIKTSGVLYDDEPSITGSGNAPRASLALQRNALPPNPATSIRMQLEQAVSHLMPKANTLNNLTEQRWTKGKLNPLAIKNTYNDDVKEFANTLVNDGYATATDNGIRTTDKFKQLISAVRNAKSMNDPSVSGAMKLLQYVAQKDKGFEVMASLMKEQRMPNPATSIRMQLEQAINDAMANASSRALYGRTGQRGDQRKIGIN